MYTLKKVLELVNAGEDIYCEVYRYETGRFITKGWLSDLDLEFDTKIKTYRMDHYLDGDECLALFLA